MAASVKKTAAPQQQQASIPIGQPSLVQMPSLPGVRRDGTNTDSDYFSDAQWCRFVRNRPRKMGGYKEATPFLSGPPRGGFMFSRQFMNLYVSFSQYGVEYTLVDPGGIAGEVVTITPSGYTHNPNAIWSYDYLYDAAAGTTTTLLIASPMSTLQNIDDTTAGGVYVTPLNAPTQMTAVGGASTTGGLFCTAPYTVLLGNDGNVTWSDANLPKTYSSGDAGTARVTGAKLIKGLPMRTGSTAGGLIWSLDSVVRMDYIGGSAIFRFSHISTKSSVLSQRGILEVDGKWYWAGIDRFMVSNGVQVEELPNEMNLNWFYDNINFAQRQKVFAMYMPRYGEIWWFFPFGDSDECNKAVIFNVRSKTWYDTDLFRGHGMTPASFQYPIMTHNQENSSVQLTLTLVSGTLANGTTITGLTSGATGYLRSFTGAGPYTAYVTLSQDRDFVSGETYTCGTATGLVSTTRSLFSMFTHENGHDAVENGAQVAIASHFTTCDFGAPTGGPNANAQTGVDINTRITRVEPDLNVKGEMNLQVLSRTFAQSEEKASREYTFAADTGKIDLREQAREFRLKFSSNCLGGFYEGGKTLVHLEPGDARP